MKKLIWYLFLFAMPFVTVAGNVSVTAVTAQQRYPWNGLVDVTVTLQGSAEDVAKSDCLFAAKNGATKAAIPIEHITRNGDDVSSGNVWTRKFLWDAKADVGAVKIDDVALTVDAEIGYGGVQLWENGPYWAKCNVGATKPEECGYYFWWGDTVGYKRNASNDGWVSVKDDTGFSFSSGNCPTYNKSISQLQSAVYIDSTGNLVAAHDAATVHLGAPWRMPTDAEFSALINNCDTEWTTRNGVSGRLVKGRGAYASKSIFLPAAGYGGGPYLYDLGSDGGYWSSSPSSGSSYDAWYLNVGSGGFDGYNRSRRSGRSVRPVRGFADMNDVVGSGVTTHFVLDPIACIVTFNANGGSCETSSEQYFSGLTLGTLPLTSRNGSRFVGWFTEVVGGDLVTEDSIVDADRTLYAHWDRYAYDFKWLGGGKLDICTGTRRTDEVQGIAMDSAWVNGGARAVVSVDGVEKAESRGADEFVWSGDETKEYTLKHQVYDAQGRAVGEPYTAKIAWTSRAAVTFDGGNGEEAFSREYDESYAYGELPSVTKTGHAFAGWYTAAEGGEKVEVGAQFDGSVSKLYAHWTVNQYGVKFDKNGGEGTAGDLTVAYGDVVPMDGVAFRKSGYRLAGWATAADGAAVYGQGGVMSNLTAEANGSVQLYAVWEPTTVDLKSFRQRYPWNGFVDVECEVGAEGRVGLLLIDEESGTNFTAKTLFCQGGSVTNSALWMAEGLQKFIWDAGSDLPDGFKTSKLKAKTYFVEGEE